MENAEQTYEKCKKKESKIKKSNLECYHRMFECFFLCCFVMLMWIVNTKLRNTKAENENN